MVERKARFALGSNVWQKKTASQDEWDGGGLSGSS